MTVFAVTHQDNRVQYIFATKEGAEAYIQTLIGKGFKAGSFVVIPYSVKGN